MIDYSVDEAGVCTISWNNPHGPVNIMNDAAKAAFIAAVNRALDDAAVKGVIVASAKRDFIAGGDLEGLRAVTSPQQGVERVRELGTCLRKMETGAKPFVAALNGSALGGGLELALACHRRLVVDNPAIQVGCPEVTLGLMPGTGATQRLPRLIGIKPASRMLLEGKPVPLAEAHKLGVVDEVVSESELLSRAKAWILANPGAQQPWDRKGFRYRDFQPQSIEGRTFFFFAWPKTRKTTPPEDPATGAILHVMAQGLERGIDAGLEIERRYFGTVVCSYAAKNRIRTLFFAKNAARKLTQTNQSSDWKRIGVVGAGQMGSGIALSAARSGLDVVLLDVSEEAAQAGMKRIQKNLDSAVERSRMTAAERDSVLAHVKPGTSYADLSGCQAVIEAVVESGEVKEAVFRQVEKTVDDACLLASNTSTLSITALAKARGRPERFIGLHFFSPVDRMALVEVVLGKKTSEAILARSLGLVGVLGKTPVIVNDGPGFFTSRIVAARSREALRMLGEGVSPALVDNVGVLNGMPVGPFVGSDWTSYDLLAEIQGGLVKAGRGTAKDGAPSLGVIRKLLELGRVGRKGGGGVYNYDEAGTKSLWPGLAKAFPALKEQPSPEEVKQRLFHIQSLEAVHALEEGVIKDPLQADLASVLGWGYPAFHGGVFAYVDEIGTKRFVEQCDALAAKHGNRFQPPQILRRMADNRERFHTL